MQRRDVLKRIGASSALAIGAVGSASAQHTTSLSVSEANYVAAEVDGEVREFTVDEFDAHPDTRSLSELEADPQVCCYECRECCNACCPDTECCYQGSCGYCSGC